MPTGSPMHVLCLCAESRQPRYENVLLQQENLLTYFVNRVSDAVNHIKGSKPDLIIADLPLADWNPVELLEELIKVDGLTPVIFCNPKGRTAEAVQLAKLGLYQYLSDDHHGAELLEHIEAAAEDKRARDLLSPSPDEDPCKRHLVGESWPIREVCHIVRLVAAKRCTVLISGETGTGKEMAARALHASSPRAHLPMVAVNCSALPEHLLEDELFGHVKGAFTGATGLRLGRFEQANRSTLFLDEIGDMPLDLQSKLLRVLQEREFQRLGSSENIQVDVRVLAASNINLLEKVKQGKFREDLYYRLSVVPIHMPALRERVTDIPLLVPHFVNKICRAEDIPPKKVHWETLQRLQDYSWPGNVRQLENAVEMAIALSGNRMTLYPSDFPLVLHGLTGNKSATLVPDGGLDFEHAVSQFERSILEQALRNARGNKRLAAEMLRLKRTTLTAKLRSLNVVVDLAEDAELVPRA